MHYKLVKLPPVPAALNNAHYHDVCLQDLVSDLKSEIAGNFEDLAVALLVPADEYDARCLHSAVAVSGQRQN